MGRLIDRIMLGTMKKGVARKFAANRNPMMPPRRTVALSDKAMRLIEDIAVETGSSPSEVLARSVALYKYALENKKGVARPIPASSS